MNFKPLAYIILATSSLTACTMAPVKQQKIEPFVFKEPELTPPFYALNPFNYDQPPAFEPTLAPVPTVNGPKIFAPAPTTTPSSKVG